ncbi:TrmH family RNA methyltransferase [Patescibacteria group bacterium]
MFYLILPNIRSRYNVGSIFRTADVFGVDKIFLTGYTPTPPHSRISKVALGAEEMIPWEQHKQTGRLITKLRKEGVKIIAAEVTVDSQDYRKWKPKEPLALVLGNEVTGLTKSILEKADHTIHIPMLGQKESLNVSVTAGILAAYIRQFT